MPNRILKESICYSEDIESLPAEVEVFFYRLIVNCDDFGRCDARLPILKSKLYPLREHMISNDINGYLMMLVDRNMIALYENGGIRYLQMSNWEKHQQVRAKRSKYPSMTDEGSVMISHDIKCNQVQAYVPENPYPNPYPNPNPNPNPKETSSSTQERVDYGEIVDLYHAICVSLPKVKEITEARKKVIRTVLKTLGMDGIENLFRKTEESDFLSGRKETDRTWRCGFDWIMKSANKVKIIEGYYDNKQPMTKADEWRISAESGAIAKFLEGDTS